MHKNNLGSLSIEGKKKQQRRKEILNISNSQLGISFLSNFNTLVGILLCLTDLLQSNEDVIFSISVLSVGRIKKEILDLFLIKSKKCLREN